MPTDGSGTCDYTHEEPFQWDCPHPTPEDNEYCPFHRSPDSTTEAEIRSALLQAFQADPPRWEFVGATVPGLDLRHLLIDLPNQEMIDFRDINVQGDLRMDYLTARQPLDFRGADIHGHLQGYNVDFEGECKCTGLTVTESCSFEESTFEKHATFDDIAVGDDLTLFATDFRKPVSFDGANVEGRVSLEKASFNRAVSFEEVAFGSSVDLSAEGYPELTVVPTEQPDDGVIGVTDTEIRSGVLALEHPELDDRPLYDCTKTVLGDVTIDATDDRVFPYLRFDQTEFDGFDFTAHHEELVACGYTIHLEGEQAGALRPDGGERDQTPAAIEQVYANAAKGAQSVGAAQIATNLRLRSRQQRRRSYFEQVLENSSPTAKLNSFSRYAGSMLESVVTGYGERPNRVIGTTNAIVFSYAAMYYVLAPERIDSIASAVRLSVETTLTFVLGTPEAFDSVAPEVQTTMATQSFLGFVLLGVIFVSTIKDQIM